MFSYLLGENPWKSKCNGKINDFLVCHNITLCVSWRQLFYWSLYCKSNEVWRNDVFHLFIFKSSSVNFITSCFKHPLEGRTGAVRIKFIRFFFIINCKDMTSDWYRKLQLLKSCSVGLTLLVASFISMFYGYRQAINCPHANIFLPIFSTNFVLKCATKILKMIYK